MTGPMSRATGRMSTSARSRDKAKSGCACVVQAAASAPVRNPNASPRGASVALNLTGVENVPRAIVSRFSEALARAADAREVTVVDPKLARYFVQIHLTAYSAGNGAAGLAYLSDIFDARKHRAQRLGDDVIFHHAVQPVAAK